jgi:uncharacterized lipoprotein NlpE involved in copper resistance
MKTSIITILVLVSCLLGCQHKTQTTSPTGEVITQTNIDLDITIALSQLALNGAQMAFDMWMQYERQNSTLTTQEMAAETTGRQAYIDQLQESLQALWKLKAASK